MRSCVIARSLNKSLFALTVSLSIFHASAASGSTENWPQWRGPLGTGESPKANPPTEWSEEKNIKWKIKLPGHGASTPIIWENKVFIQAAVPTGKKVETPRTPSSTPAVQPAPAPAQQRPPGEGGRQRGPGGGGRGGFGGGEKPTELYQFVVLCLDRQTGKTLWQTVAREELPHEGHHRDHGYSSFSPVTDGQHLIVSFGSRGLYCYDLNGKLIWEKDLGDMRTKMGFGEGSSPALHKNTVVVNWDHEGEDFIAAFEKSTGKELWRQPRQEDTTWSTPLIVEHNGKAQVVTTATGKVRSYDLATGELVWESPGLTMNAIPTPVTADGVVYVTSGFRGSALYAIKLGKTGDLSTTDSILWSHKKSTPYVPSPLLYKGRFYCFSGNDAIFSAFNAKSGNILVDAERLSDLNGVYASPVAAADRIYLLGRNGAALVLKHTDKLETLASNKLDDGFDASPALAGNELFLRGRQHLYCIAAK